MTERATIRRSPHNREHPYSIISNNLINDMELPLAEKAALIYLLSKPSDWVTHPMQLAETFRIGRDKIYSILKNLIRLGYCKAIKEKNAKKQYISVTYLFSEERQFQENIPHTEKPYTEKPDLENTDITNTDLRLSTESTNTLVESDDSHVKPRSSVRLVPKIIFNWDKKKFEGIEQSDLDRWKEQFPKISVPEILGLAEATIGSQPSRYRKRKQIEKTIIEFFKRQSEKPTFQKTETDPLKKNININTKYAREFVQQYSHLPGGNILNTLKFWPTNIERPDKHKDVWLGHDPEIFKGHFHNLVETKQ